MEAIVKGKYYYQVPVSADRFVKLQIKDNKINVIRERPFGTNTYASRKYTHAWLKENTLVVMAANGTADKIVWTKLNTDDMTIINEGTLSLSVAEGFDSFTTSGLLTYRKSDNKLFYFFYSKKGSGRSATKESFFHIAVINPETMAVEQEIVNKEASEMQGSAYGELMQNFMFFDDDDNLYIVGIPPSRGERQAACASRRANTTSRRATTVSPTATANCSPCSISATERCSPSHVTTILNWEQASTAMLATTPWST